MLIVAVADGVIVVAQGNAIYNIMPDVVSRLSDSEIGVPEDNFRVIMK